MHARIAMVAVAVVLALGALAVAPHPVVAAPGGGAETTTTPFNHNGCAVDEFGNTACYRDKGVYHTTRTSSGNYTSQLNVQYLCYSTTDPSGKLIYENCRNDWRETYHYKHGEFQLVRFTVDEALTTNRVTCVYETRYHFVNGKFQFQDFTSNCF